jgi:hypothetical protein
LTVGYVERFVGTVFEGGVFSFVEKRRKENRGLLVERYIRADIKWTHSIGILTTATMAFLEEERRRE